MFHPLLTTFVCAADSGSFNKAAEKLYLSSTAVIKQVNALEKHLDMRLFLRTKQGVTLTPAGRVIYKHAKGMFAYSENALNEARRTAKAGQMTFRVGTSILNPCKPFMDLWHQVDQQFPEYRLQIVPFEDDHQGILTEIAGLGEKFDFLLGVCNSRLWLDRCRMLPLGRCRKLVAVPRGHRLAGKRRLELSDLHGETLMMVKEGDSDVNDRLRADLRRDHPAIKIEDTPYFYDMSVFNRCVETGNVLLILECWRDVHPELVSIPVNWDYTIPYGLLYALDPPEDVRRFVDALRPAASGQGKADPG